MPLRFARADDDDAVAVAEAVAEFMEAVDIIDCDDCSCDRAVDKLERIDACGLLLLLCEWSADPGVDGCERNAEEDEGV
jgi:hypothetical protein